MTNPATSIATIFVFLTLTATAVAQTVNTTNGNTGFGSTGSNTGTGTNSSTGTTTAGAQSGAIGSGLSGNSAFGGSVPGQSTATSNAATTFVGQNATQAFIGGAATGSSRQQGSNRQFQAIQNNQTRQPTTQQTGTAREIRTTLRIGFAFPSATQSQNAGQLAPANAASLDRFTENRPDLAGISAAFNSDGVVVLTGSAPTVESSRLAANLMRLQPGVRQVDNQIIVGTN